jgi:AcrR family transcriptional regulator
MSVAREVFFEQGYAAASMSSIAARLGGSKGTLYNYFKSKEELFEAQLREACGHVEAVMRETPLDADPVEALTQLGHKYLAHLFSVDTANMFRILVAESQRSPELARVFYDVGPARGRQALQAYLEEARQRGLVDTPDCGLAAAQFLQLCKGDLHLQFLLNLIPPLTPEQISAQTQNAVTAFMRLYGPR